MQDFNVYFLMGILSCSHVCAQFGNMGMPMNPQSAMESGSQMADQGAQMSGNAPGASEFSAQAGQIQCKGADHFTGMNFVGNTAGSGVDFGGDYLCQPTCGGQCLANKNSGGDAPISGYAFGCKCPVERCSGAGPLIEEMKSDANAKYTFKVVCVAEAKCTCKGMDGDGDGNGTTVSSRAGYLCNWINFNAGEAMDSSKHVQPHVSPIRWCACCPLQTTRK